MNDHLAHAIHIYIDKLCDTVDFRQNGLLATEDGLDKLITKVCDEIPDTATSDKQEIAVVSAMCWLGPDPELAGSPPLNMFLELLDLLQSKTAEQVPSNLSIRDVVVVFGCGTWRKVKTGRLKGQEKWLGIWPGIAATLAKMCQPYITLANDWLGYIRVIDNWNSKNIYKYESAARFSKWLQEPVKTPKPIQHHTALELAVLDNNGPRIAVSFPTPDADDKSIPENNKYVFQPHELSNYSIANAGKEESTTIDLKPAQSQWVVASNQKDKIELTIFTPLLTLLLEEDAILETDPPTLIACLGNEFEIQNGEQTLLITSEKEHKISIDATTCLRINGKSIPVYPGQTVKVKNQKHKNKKQSKVRIIIAPKTNVLSAGDVARFLGPAKIAEWRCTCGKNKCPDVHRLENWDTDYSLSSFIGTTIKGSFSNDYHLSKSTPDDDKSHLKEFKLHSFKDSLYFAYLAVYASLTTIDKEFLFCSICKASNQSPWAGNKCPNCKHLFNPRLDKRLKKERLITPDGLHNYSREKRLNCRSCDSLYAVPTEADIDKLRRCDYCDTEIIHLKDIPQKLQNKLREARVPMQRARIFTNMRKDLVNCPKCSKNLPLPKWCPRDDCETPDHLPQRYTHVWLDYTALTIPTETESRVSTGSINITDRVQAENYKAKQHSDHYPIFHDSSVIAFRKNALKNFQFSYKKFSNMLNSNSFSLEVDDSSIAKLIASINAFTHEQESAMAHGILACYLIAYDKKIDSSFQYYITTTCDYFDQFEVYPEDEIEKVADRELLLGFFVGKTKDYPNHEENELKLPTLAAREVAATLCTIFDGLFASDAKEPNFISPRLATAQVQQLRQRIYS